MSRRGCCVFSVAFGDQLRRWLWPHRGAWRQRHRSSSSWRLVRARPGLGSRGALCALWDIGPLVAPLLRRHRPRAPWKTNRAPSAAQVLQWHGPQLSISGAVCRFAQSALAGRTGTSAVRCRCDLGGWHGAWSRGSCVMLGLGMLDLETVSRDVLETFGDVS